MTISNDLKKEYLCMYPEAILKVREVQHEIDQLRLSAYLPKSPAFDDMPGHGPSEGHADTSVYVAALEAISEEELAPALEWQREIKHLISASIDALPTATERKIMRARYLSLDQTPEERRTRSQGTKQPDWQTVARRTSYAYDTVTHRHGDALKHLQVPDKIIRMLASRHANTSADDLS